MIRNFLKERSFWCHMALFPPMDWHIKFVPWSKERHGCVAGQVMMYGRASSNAAMKMRHNSNQQWERPATRDGADASICNLQLPNNSQIFSVWPLTIAEGIFF